MKTSTFAFLTSIILGLAALGTPALASAHEGRWGGPRWDRGAWARPRPGYVVAPRWEQRGGRYNIVRGGWRRR